MLHLIKRDALLCDCLVFNSCDWRISILAVLVSRSLCSPYNRTAFLLLCFLIVGIHASGIYMNSTFNVVRVKSYVNHLFDPASVTVKITINRLYFIPKRVVSGVVSVLRNCGPPRERLTIPSHDFHSL